MQPQRLVSCQKQVLDDHVFSVDKKSINLKAPVTRQLIDNILAMRQTKWKMMKTEDLSEKKV